MNSVASFFSSSSGYRHGPRSLSISWLVVTLIAIAAVFSTVQRAEAARGICDYNNLCGQYPPAPFRPWVCMYMKYNILGQKIGCSCYDSCR